MSAATVNFTVVNTTHWKLTFNLTRDGEPWDVSDYTAKMQLRAPAENSVAAATFTTEAGTLQIVGASLSIDVPRGITLGILPGAYDHDILLVSKDETLRAVEGVVTVKQGVTR